MLGKITISAMLVLMLTVGCLAVNAQTSVSLQLASSSTLTFAAGSPSILTLPATTGAAGGTGLLSGATSYMLTGGPITLTSTGGNNYSASGTIDVTIFSGTTAVLSGTLDLIDFVQHGKTGVFNIGLLTNLDITGGTFCSEVGAVCGANAGFVTITTAFPTGIPITHGVLGRVFTGTIMPLSPTPEPASMLLFGTGLLALGGVIRRRQRSA